VGAGLGNLSSYISDRQDSFIINIEIDARRKLPNMVVCDGAKLPFITEAFDFTVSCDVFEHVREKNRPDFIKESLRCCKCGLVLTFSEIHARNPSQGGIKIFEKLAGFSPDWYIEHNENKIVNETLLAKNIKENQAKIANIKPLVGLFTLFLTGFSLFIQGKIRLRTSHFLFQVTSYLMTRLIDFPPFYGFGLTAIKTDSR
jgi:2-polyprenyl-3-methyl-5-hydroxy-6-metoxy-1,4-benzoquinol methylase